MTDSESKFIELIMEVNMLEKYCKTVDGCMEQLNGQLMPSKVYDLLDSLRNELARWGCEELQRRK
jgi:hypothetical protein